ncbi:bacteriohemerythrin [Magnetospira sp. QH-2]|uniref:bacteriohemerythrin n=1 Tax=Magnetospira sp. (strain QH-2) TaxID=1288970 RepID=UPI0003E80C13|nr:bacteriohemerythrin [Magnetospira sp. QH-2]CCQ75157.1 conserved protein of unknown function[Include Cyclic nucleotide-binding domain and Hemerythrin HHE cation binding domain] [Magnetospira sp. QH-2]
MLKIRVANGIHWVEIPEADLRIQCGCPADSIKHLYKRGLIQSLEVDGVPFENGPNAILLSDRGLQKGDFANLAEFPVLQILYRQGMIIPGHPNNKGVKPLLIGAEEQIRTQMEYIFRGNYGLISEEEMIEAGVDEETARQWMRMKLRFAFGAIRSPRDLLDTKVLENQPVEIRPGVTIKRLGENRFEIRHGEERAEVDLNLSASENYETPYQLSHHDLKREYFAVVHTGEGDGWDVNRPSMGSILMFQGRIFLIDAGPNIDASLRALGIGIQEVAGMFHTHGHDDHFAGLTALIRADHRIRYYATPEVWASVAKKMSGLMAISEESVAEFFDVRLLKLGEWNDVDGLEVKPIHSPHPVETTPFLFRVHGDGEYFSYAHMADIAAFSVLDGMVTEDSTAPGISKQTLEAVRADYLTEVNIKKLDIGGGMIHGDAADFESDSSGKLILAHRATPLSLEEKEIGSGAPFGTVEVLIPALQDYCYRDAANFLKTYFPKAKPHQLGSLLNHEIRTFNPEAIMAREGRPCTEVMLVLSGQVEVIKGSKGIRGLVAAGAMIGEIGAIGGFDHFRTFRSRSFVSALCLPVDSFKRFINENGLESEIKILAGIQEFLEQSAPFGENMSQKALRRLAAAVRVTTLEPGEAVDWRDGDRFCLVQKGELDIMVGDTVAETVGPWGVCGEICVLHGVEPIYRAVARDRVRMAVIPADLVAEIPVARWKLLELYQTRMHKLVINVEESDVAFPWLDEYSIGIDSMDDQHKKLFDLANVVADSLDSDHDTLEAIQAMVAYTEHHFEIEEALLRTHRYEALDRHAQVHRYLVSDVKRIAERIQSGETIVRGEFRSFFLSWMVYHILMEDRKYARAITHGVEYAI